MFSVLRQGPATPYRSPGFPVEPANPDPDLGAERSVHRAYVFALLPSALSALVPAFMGVGFAPVLGWKALLVAPFAAALALLLGAPAFRLRGVRVVLHARGLVVQGPHGRDVVDFSTVRDVFWEGLTLQSMAATVGGLRLVDQRGRSHRVPLRVERCGEVLRWVERHCSEPILPDARAALRTGESLTFGPVTIDREGVRFQTRARVPWHRVRLVRLLPGRVAFFRAQVIFPWKTVRLDAVPHPSIFLRLVREAAPKTEVYPAPAG